MTRILATVEFFFDADDLRMAGVSRKGLINGLTDENVKIASGMFENLTYGSILRAKVAKIKKSRK